MVRWIEKVKRESYKTGKMGKISKTCELGKTGNTVTDKMDNKGKQVFMFEEKFIWTEICKIQADLIIFLMGPIARPGSLNLMYLLDCNVPLITFLPI